jgi:hypothetical protein
MFVERGPKNQRPGPNVTPATNDYLEHMLVRENDPDRSDLVGTREALRTRVAPVAAKQILDRVSGPSLKQMGAPTESSASGLAVTHIRKRPW